MISYFCKVYFPNVRCLSSKISVQLSGERCSRVVYSEANLNNSLTNCDALAQFLSTRVVAYGRHFLVLDKPAGLSVWGHSTAKQNVYAQPQSPTISVKDCLPHLRTLLTQEFNLWPAGDSCRNEDKYRPLIHPCSIFCYKDDRMPTWKPPKDLFIVESLPAAYSGLILLATSKEYADFARKFYSDANRSVFPGCTYQTIFAACWGTPIRKNSSVETFPISVHKFSDSISISFKATMEKMSGVQRRNGTLLQKQIGHQLIATGKGSLVGITCNSIYAGLPELFLLHEGCEVIGESLQASRLITTGQSSVVLSPTAAHLNSPLPKNLARVLGDASLIRSELPVHLHRSELLLPLPLPAKNDRHQFVRKLSATRGRITSVKEFSKNQNCLGWRDFPTGGSKSDKRQFFLSARSLCLPSHFNFTLDRFGIEFDPLRYFSLIEQTKSV